MCKFLSIGNCWMEDFNNDSKAISHFSPNHKARSIHKVANGAGVGSGGIWTKYPPPFD